MNDFDYMRRCFLLAEKGMNNVSPNPRVGAVIVVDDFWGVDCGGGDSDGSGGDDGSGGNDCCCDDDGGVTGENGGGSIIGEGWHKQYGYAHAEVNAIDNVRKRYGATANELLRRSTLYVNLEPCSHYGKTPPCVDLIIKYGIPRVVISCLDPNPRVNGAGVERLRATGCEVTTGILEKNGKFLNRRFFTRITKNRPYIILKWAQSADGFIAPLNMQPIQGGFRLTSNETQIEDHKLRANEDAIMVGTNTLLIDNPQLNKRLFKGDNCKNPLRISFDLHNRLPDTLNFFDGSQPTLLFISENPPPLDGLQSTSPFISTNINIQEPILPQVIQELNKRKLNSLIVEGGTTLLNSFIEACLYDEIRVYTASVRLGGGLEAPVIPNDVEVIEDGVVGDDRIVRYIKKENLL
jgi:diaminohydroxyphosphoribosylaminopyrimidine deaminase/5-amino-6-(5-phosphoribosylamino)uracil reductase